MTVAALPKPVNIEVMKMPDIDEAKALGAAHKNVDLLIRIVLGLYNRQHGRSRFIKYPASNGIKDVINTRYSFSIHCSSSELRGFDKN